MYGGRVPKCHRRRRAARRCRAARPTVEPPLDEPPLDAADAATGRELPPVDDVPLASHRRCSLPLVDELELTLVVVEVVVPAVTGKIVLAGFGTANVLCLPTASDWIWKSKSTPMYSKKLSLTVMNRTSIDT